MSKEELLKLSILINDVHLFESLIRSEEPVDLNWSDSDGRSALHWAAIMDTGQDYAKILVQYGADLTLEDKTGCTPRALAKKMGHHNNADFLKKLEAGSTISGKTGSQVSKTDSKKAEPFHVIIVGAGVSGIQTAHELVQNNCRVTMLEARSRIGGRIHTGRLGGGVSVELGCNFIHGPGGNPLTPLLKKFDIDFSPVTPANTAIYDPDGTRVDLDSLSPISEKIKSKIFFSTKKRFSEASEYKSVAPQTAFVNSFREMAREGAGYTPHKKNSLLSYKIGYSLDHVGGNYLITNGYYRLPELLLEEAKKNGHLELKLQTVVKHISQRGEKVFVTTESGTEIEANAVVCTVPLRVLDYILFDPPLPANKKDSMNRLGMAVHDKIILEFEEVFWPFDMDYLLPYDVDAEIWREIVNLHHFSKGKTATLIMSNYLKLTNLKKSDTELVDEAVKTLKRILEARSQNSNHLL